MFDFFINLKEFFNGFSEIFYPVVVLIVAAYGFLYERRRHRLIAIERNYEALQKLNYTALATDDNLIAALKSVCDCDVTSVDEARKIFFHYLRINRLFRVWQLGSRKWKTIRDKDVDEIVDAYIVTLLETENIIDTLLERGYPPRFQKYLKNKIIAANKNGKSIRPFNLCTSDIKVIEEIENSTSVSKQQKRTAQTKKN